MGHRGTFVAVVMWLAAALTPRVCAAQPGPWVPGDLPGDTVAAPAQWSQPAPGPPPAPDPPAPRFGSAGEVVFTGASSIGVSSTGWSASQASTRGFTISPGVDWFVARDVAIGLTMDVGYSDQAGYLASGLTETKSTSFSGGPRFGVNVPIGSRLSLYPRVAGGFEWTDVRDAYSGASTAHSGPWASVWVPLLWHPVSHFFAGFGPSASYVFADTGGSPATGGARFSGSVGAIVGGWIGGGPAPPAEGEDAQPAPGARPRHFGDQGVLVLSGDFVTSAGGTSWVDAGGASSWSVTVGPACDYFIARHASIGAAFDLFTASENGAEPTTGIHYASTRSGGSIAPRLGADIPITDWASVWLHFTIGYGVAHRDFQEAAAADKYTEQYLWVGMYLPVVFQLAQHFFVGFGPEASTDLTHTFAPDMSTQSRSNLGTTVGASLTVGGWL